MKKTRTSLIYLAPIMTFIFGFLSFLILSIHFDVFWITSKYDVPLILNISVMVGDSILLPTLNYKIFKLCFIELNDNITKKQLVTVFSIILTVSVLFSIHTHITWLKDSVSDFISFSNNNFSIIGYWHLVFSAIEMSVLMIYPFLWYKAIKNEVTSAIQYSTKIWKYFLMFCSLNIFDMLNKYFFVYDSTLMETIHKEGFPFTMIIVACILLIIMKTIEKKQLGKKS